MHLHRAALSLAVLLGGLTAACGSSGPDTSTNPPSGPTYTPQPTAPGLPFQYEATGESSSPSFHITKAGAYTVAWTLKGTPDTPSCTMSIAVVSDDGITKQVLPSTVVKSADTKPGQTPLDLTAGNWRFQEGGGCQWSVTVNQAG
jgi:hypothetical protein